MRRISIAFVIIALGSTLTGCSTIGKAWKNLLGRGDDSGTARVSTPRFSEKENINVSSDRQYRRMNRQRFEEEADVRADAGSLWVMEGQGAYLFSQNQTRMVGDLLNVKIEGGPKSQLQTKVKVISKLLERLESPARGLASQQAQAAPQAAAQAAQPGAAPADGAAPAAPQVNESAKQPTLADVPFNVQTVPTRIVEQLKDGSYRVRGMQPFMIGKREYKVIVTGIVRGEDFNDEGLTADKLLDPQFDIVSARKGAAL
ncbi:MAG TPA: flagellar basal body L-ring protein FlgH [Bdellovibrionales bacterium]|nr:flagellar basal body L-ring protein FlgH [Bdellovibrionales bacterium]